MNANYRYVTIGFMVALAGNAAFVDAQTCDDNGGLSPYVCVDWSQGVDPAEGFDFEFDFTTDAANPGVTLKVGDPGWKLWSQVSSTNTTAANLGAIKLDPTVSTDDFEVAIRNAAGAAGAANVGSMVLNAKNWTGLSSIKGGSILGDLIGSLVVVQDSGGAGGEVTFTINGDARARSSSRRSSR